MITVGIWTNEKISLWKFITDRNGYPNESKAWYQLPQPVAAGTRDY